MSRIRVNIDRLVLNGFEPLEGKAVANAFEAQLQQVLADPLTRGEWARPHRTPVLKLDGMSMKTGTVSSGTLGKRIAQAVGKGLKP